MERIYAEARIGVKSWNSGGPLALWRFAATFVFSVWLTNGWSFTMTSIARSIVLVVLFVLAVWAVGSLLGFNISLVGTLIGSVVLTLLATLIFGGLRKIRTR